jgi:ribosomal protein S11
MISGPGPGRDTALRAIRRSGVILNFVCDVTPMPKLVQEVQIKASSLGGDKSLYNSKNFCQ